jgi:demethylmenaquinone methyltransferase / 2-methoxy-6-polyprenyl-1,4-benzoquinol methylase
MSTTTHFGYREISEASRQDLVNQVFNSVAGRYDLMNDLMSLGTHRLWKDFTIEQAYLRPHETILDLAGGTGDLSERIYQKLLGQCQLILSDINNQMLSVGRDRLVNQNKVQNIHYVLANAEQLPFAENSLDCVFMSFGLRNVTRIDQALASIFNSLSPGGRVLILEFSKPYSTYFNKIYDAYSFHVIPKLGELCAGDKESYQYLAESIRMFPDQETLKAKMQAQGFEQVDYFNLAGGIVALHRGYKF